jgi:hypothetical protein
LDHELGSIYPEQSKHMAASNALADILQTSVFAACRLLSLVESDMQQREPYYSSIISITIE